MQRFIDTFIEDYVRSNWNSISYTNLSDITDLDWYSKCHSLYSSDKEYKNNVDLEYKNVIHRMNCESRAVSLYSQVLAKGAVYNKLWYNNYKRFREETILYENIRDDKSEKINIIAFTDDLETFSESLKTVSTFELEQLTEHLMNQK